MDSSKKIAALPGEKVIREAWAGRRTRKNQWLNHFKWLFWGMKATLRFPYSINSKGEFEIKFLSLSFLYWVVIYCLMVAINIENIIALFDKVLKASMDPDQAVQAAYNALVLLFITLYPGSFIREFKVMALYINKWVDFEETYLRGIGSPITFEYSKINLFIKWVLTPSALFVMWALKNVLFWTRWYSLIPPFLMGVSYLLVLNYWTLGAYELCSISQRVKQKIIDNFCSTKRVTAEEIRDVRLAWLELKVMIKRFSDSVSFIFTYLSLMFCCIFIMSAFVNIVFMSSGKCDFGLFVIMVISGGALVAINDCGYLLTLSAGQEICESLPLANVHAMDPGAVEEIKLFMNIIRMNYPRVSFGGMIKANRSTVTSIISVTVTYLVVLLQFQSADVPPVSLFVANSTNPLYQGGERPF